MKIREFYKIKNAAISKLTIGEGIVTEHVLEYCDKDHFSILNEKCVLDPKVKEVDFIEFQKLAEGRICPFCVKFYNHGKCTECPVVKAGEPKCSSPASQYSKVKYLLGNTRIVEIQDIYLLAMEVVRDRNRKSFMVERDTF